MRSNRLRIHHLSDNGADRLTLKRWAGGYQIIENRSQAIDIAVPAKLAPAVARLLRRHEVGRAEHLARYRQARVSIQPACQPEIRDARLIVRGINQHIRRLEVSV